MSAFFSSGRRSNYFVLLVILLFLSGCALHFFRGYYSSESIYPFAWGVDDAFISFRYGWNAVHFGNLSWNESGFRKTEGFTNPLWVLVSAIWSLPGNKDWVYPGVVMTAVFLSAYMLFVAQKFLLEKYKKTIALTGMLIFCVTPFVWADATSGLESVVFGIILALLAYMAGHLASLGREQKYQIIAFSFLACLLRSDGEIYVAIILAGLLISRNPSAKLVLIGMLSGSLLLYLARYLYFGTFLPNTAVAKLNFGVLERLPIGFEIFFVVLLFGASVFLFMGFMGMRSSGKFKTQIIDSCILLGWFGYFIYIGGDIFHERHLIGSFAYAAMISSDYWSKKNLTDVVKITGVLAVLLMVPLLFFDARFSYWRSKPDDPLTSLGKEIGLNRNRYGTIAIPTSGKIPFFAGGDFVDVYGLNDPYLATIKRPNFIPGHSSGSDSEAIEIARRHSPENYSLVNFTPTPYLRLPDDVYLWVYTSQPQDGIHRHFTDADFQVARTSVPIYMCLVIYNPH